LAVIVRLSASRKRFLSEKNALFLAEQPRLRLLRRRLLAIAGQEVVLIGPEHYLEAILAHPVLWRDGSVRKIPGAMNQCHRNVARAYLRGPSTHQIATGWAFHDGDVVWRKHSWVLRKGELCETTVPAKLYYGVVLDKGQASRFVRAELGTRSSASRTVLDHGVRRSR
jgi:hypothetical protein